MLDKLIQEAGSFESTYFLWCVLGVFAISLLLIPKIRSIAIKLNLSDAPDNRSSHIGPVPTFGGVIFYVSYILVLFFAQHLDVNHVSVTLLASISILFFTGLLDDFRNLSPRIKFLFQIIGVAILMFQTDFRILSLHGFMGVYEIPIVVSIAGSMFFLLALINAFNLIDGIDGLSGITGIIIASFYSFVLFKLGYYFYLSISLATIGTLLAFLRFNFSIKRKIFMGDTGSLVIGLVLGLLTLKLMTVGDTVHNALSFNRSQLPLFLVGVLFIPTLDTIRVMLLRFTRGVSMFKPDRNHIHHILIDFGFSHRKASFCIGFINFLVASIMFYVTQQFTIVISLLILIIMFFTAFTVLFLMNKNQTAIRLKVKIRKSMVKLLSL
ncbi:undecaprenyl/decaprenyl-phosphate alpha-N-acetylglucosaminyl 1-phosphate transferase [Flavobacteriaceae bacterium]|nr:undecaprenyl/decaprenyl-phosphate alpha-N-acetylglucosaminyl 1-phosphate transferase [Flavobacteriaceae bacterium]